MNHQRRGEHGRALICIRAHTETRKLIACDKGVEGIQVGHSHSQPIEHIQQDPSPTPRHGAKGHQEAKGKGRRLFRAQTQPPPLPYPTRR